MIAGGKRQPTIGNTIPGMACQRPGQGPVTKERRHGPPGGPGRGVRGRAPGEAECSPGLAQHRGRRCLRLAALAAALGAGWLAAGPAAAAPATGAGTASAATAGRAGARPHPWIAITSLSPTIAAPKGKVIVSGIVANPTSAALPGLSVQLWSSAVALSSRGSMHSYLTAASAAGLETQVPGAQVPLPGRVPPHGTQQWKLTLDVAQTGIRTFGVYPLAAQLTGAGPVPDVARTLLPFWPRKPARHSVKPLTIGWGW